MDASKKMEEAVERETERLIPSKEPEKIAVYLEMDKGNYYKLGNGGVQKIECINRMAGDFMQEFFRIHFENGDVEEISRDFVAKVKYVPAQ